MAGTGSFVQEDDPAGRGRDGGVAEPGRRPGEEQGGTEGGVGTLARREQPANEDGAEGDRCPEDDRDDPGARPLVWVLSVLNPDGSSRVPLTRLDREKGASTRTTQARATAMRRTRANVERWEILLCRVRQDAWVIRGPTGAPRHRRSGTGGRRDHHDRRVIPSPSAAREPVGSWGNQTRPGDGGKRRVAVRVERRSRCRWRHMGVGGWWRQASWIPGVAAMIVSDNPWTSDRRRRTPVACRLRSAGPEMPRSASRAR